MVAADLQKHSPSKRERPSSSSKSDDIMISTWSDGELVDSSSVKIFLPKYIESEGKVYEELSNQNFIAGFDQVGSFVQSYLREETKRYSQLVKVCTEEGQSENKCDHMLKLLLTLNTDSFASNNVSTWQKPKEDQPKVRVIHKKRKKFSAPNGSPYSLRGSLYEYLKDPE